MDNQLLVTNSSREAILHYSLKRHSQLCDCADLDTSFSHFEKSLPQPEIKVHLEIRFIFPSVLLDFQSFTEKPVFECPFAPPMILFFIWYMQISYGMVCNAHVHQLTLIPTQRQNDCACSAIFACEFVSSVRMDA